MSSPCGCGDVHARHPLHQVNRLQLDPVHIVYLSCFQGICPGIGIDDGKRLKLIEMASALFPVIGVTGGKGSYPWLPAFQHIGAGADPFFPFRTGRARGTDGEMVITHDKREIRTPAGKFEDYLIFAVGSDIFDIFQIGLGPGLRFFAPVMINGIDNILGRHCLAVMKLHALAQLECPDFGIWRGVP